jgi:hypothetical protein
MRRNENAKTICILIGFFAVPMIFGLMAQEMPQTTKQNVKGAASAKTEHLRNGASSLRAIGWS